MWFAVVATLVIGALIYKLFFAPEKNFWKQYGIRQIDPSVAVSSLDVLMGRKSLIDADNYVYSQLSSSEKFCGVMENGTPMLLVKDIEIIKKLLIKDFDYFIDRRKFFTRHDGTLSKMLSSLDGEEWKGVRSAVSPTFTSGKIRKMMEYFNSLGLEWVEEFTKKAKGNPSGEEIVDVLKVTSRYTIDVISSTVFGMKTNTIKNPEETFNKMATRLMDFTSLKPGLMFLARMLFPGLSDVLRLSPFDQNALGFFERILEQGLKSRMSGEIKRNDFLQLLVEARKGELENVGVDELNALEKDAQIKRQGGKEKKWLTEEMMKSQGVAFFFAGFGTTSSLITFMMFALALNQNVQNKLREEIRKIKMKDVTFDYDDVGNLLYLDMVMYETIRKCTTSGRLERVCVREYRNPEIGLVVPKGAVIGIPATAIHHDKEYFENPEKFDPEHFSPEKKAARNPHAFMPWGFGPRNCIGFWHSVKVFYRDILGMRFAQIAVKAAICHIVNGFLIEPTANTPTVLQGKEVTIHMFPPKDLELKLTPVSPN